MTRRPEGRSQEAPEYRCKADGREDEKR
jgi:hypothetical protein